MKYYAVTDDPNELMHYGVLGMKWGVVHDKPRHPGSGRRSSAYKKAQGKLGKMMRSGIKKAEASWKAYNSPEAKYQRQTNRALQQARKGKLKYGKLSDDQVRRITERLSLERQARQVSETEKTVGKRVMESIGEGIISGIGRGFGNRASELISRGGVLKTDRKRAEQQEEFERQKDERRIRNAEREARRKAKREFKQKQMNDDYEFNRDQERERRRLEDRAANAYLYGAKYDNDGKMNSDSLKDFYNQKYVKRKTIQLETAENNARAAQKEYARLTEASRDANERVRRQSELSRNAEIERQRRAKAEMAAEADRIRKAKEQESAWANKQRRIAEAKEKEEYRSRVTKLANERAPLANGYGRIADAQSDNSLKRSNNHRKTGRRRG